MIDRKEIDMDKVEKFKKEYMCEWIHDDTTLNPMEMCLLHLYTQVYKNCQWIHNQMRESPNNNLDFLAHEINKICYELKINSEKIFDISQVSGRLRPKKFEKYINAEIIPTIYKSEYHQVNELYSKISAEDRKRQEEREKERHNDGYYFFKL